MKKLTSAIALLFLMTIATSNISAQNFRAGTGVTYASNIDAFGVSINGVYSFNNKISIAPSYTYFFASDFVTWNVINVDMHYNFNSQNGFDFYGIAGANITMVSLDYDWAGLDDFSSTSTNFGLNLGAGASKNITDKLDLFGELKYTFSDGSYFSLVAGLLYNF